jgi:hypothetical protein
VSINLTVLASRFNASLSNTDLKQQLEASFLLALTTLFNMTSSRQLFKI